MQPQPIGASPQLSPTQNSFHPSHPSQRGSSGSGASPAPLLTPSALTTEQADGERGIGAVESAPPLKHARVDELRENPWRAYTCDRTPSCSGGRDSTNGGRRTLLSFNSVGSSTVAPSPAERASTSATPFLPLHLSAPRPAEQATEHTADPQEVLELTHRRGTPRDEGDARAGASVGRVGAAPVGPAAGGSGEFHDCVSVSSSQSVDEATAGPVGVCHTAESRRAPDGSAELHAKTEDPTPPPTLHAPHFPPRPGFVPAPAAPADVEGEKSDPQPTLCKWLDETEDGEPRPRRAAETPDPLQELSDEQREVFRLVVEERRSVFVTGGAGTGKSYLIRTLVKNLPSSTTFITATTGIAAMNLGGTTVHSFAGCGLVEEGDNWRVVASRIAKNKKKKQTWMRCRVLIIDEVSMLGAFMFDLLEFVARYVRRSSEPFGGIQLVLTGDFLQLPPVRRSFAGRRPKGPSFPFESEVWLKVNPQVCLLSRPFRQRNEAFFHLLNEMRFGEMSPASIARLTEISDISSVNIVRGVDANTQDLSDARVARVNDSFAAGRRMLLDGPAAVAARGSDAQMKLVFTDQRGNLLQRTFDGYVNLRSKRDEVDQENDYYYRQISPFENPQYVYRGFHKGEGSFPRQNIQEELRLRVGCRVMLVKNFDTAFGLVNGSTGTVTGFVDCSKRFQFKSGTGVALNEARLICVGVDGDAQRRHTMLPVVRFDVSANKSMEIAVEPNAWEERRGDEVISTTYQLPLILAYAITIHKSQGMSLTQVDIDLKSVFEAGQAYVALSRCTELEKVRLHGFSVDKVHPDSSALAYYKALGLYRQRTTWQRERQLQRSGEGDGATDSADSQAARLLMENDRLRSRPLTPYGYDGVQARALHLYVQEVRRLYGGPPAQAVQADEHAEPLESAASVVQWSKTEPREEEGEEQRNEEEGAVPPALLASETVHLDILRRYVTRLLEASQQVRELVARRAMAATSLRGVRLVLDATAVHYLLTGADSATVFDQLINSNGNMLRLPSVIKQHLMDMASAGAGADPDEPCPKAEGRASRHETATPTTEAEPTVQDSAARGEQDGAEQGSAEGDALAEVREIAADALALINDWRASLVLDEQRSDEVAPLADAALLPAWRRFAGILPLLRAGAASAGDEPADELMPPPPTANGSPAPDDAVSEVEFLLSRDPREALTHRGVLEYALHLRNLGGSRVAICTNSPTLAAYALAYDLIAATVGDLARGR